MIGQKRGQMRTQDLGEEITKISLQNSARDAAIGAHQIDDIACKRRQLATCGQRIEDCAQSLLHPLPVRARDMRQDVVDMRMAPKAGNDEESQVAKGDLPVITGNTCGGLRYISSVSGDQDRVVPDLSRYFESLEHPSTL